MSKLMLRELREASGMTPRQMYERLGIQDSRYRKWESEAAQIPIEYASRCCEILHCSLDELMGRTPTTLSDDEQELLRIYRGLSTSGREYMMGVARVTAGLFPAGA